MSYVWNNVNPTTGGVINTFTSHTLDEAIAILNQVHTEQVQWGLLSVSDRADGILKFSELLEKSKKDLALMMATEMGKPITQGLQEVEKCIQTCRYYVEHGSSFLASQDVESQYNHSWILKRPLGVVLAIMPWNFPLWQVIRCAIPALLVGNTILLKHAPLVQGFAQHLEKLFFTAFQKNILKQVSLQHHDIETLIAHPQVAALTFTGSTRAGRSIGALAGVHLKKCVLELGGSDPYFIFEDADLELAASLCVKSRFVNGGQSCVAAKRFYIHKNVYSDFKNLVVEKTKKLKVGSPFEEQTQIGPLAEERFLIQLKSQVDQSINEGATVVWGGDPLAHRNKSDENSSFNNSSLNISNGFFMSPLILENLNPNSNIMCEEIFGPVMPLMSVESMESAIQQSELSHFGLGAAIFTKQTDKAWRIAVEQLQCGMVAINDMVSSDPRLPFGGVKHSGFGRELGLYGLHEFTNIKTIGVR